LTYEDFMDFDDNALLTKIADLKVGHLQPYRQRAKEVLLRAIPDYEYRILRRPTSCGAQTESGRLPPDLFVDLMSDHGFHQLYRQGSVLLHQRLTERISTAVCLEEGSGALSRIFSEGNSPALVPNGFYVFLPHGWQHRDKEWRSVEQSISSGVILQKI